MFDMFVPDLTSYQSCLLQSELSTHQKSGLTSDAASDIRDDGSAAEIARLSQQVSASEMEVNGMRQHVEGLNGEIQGHIDDIRRLKQAVDGLETEKKNFVHSEERLDKEVKRLRMHLIQVCAEEKKYMDVLFFNLFRLKRDILKRHLLLKIGRRNSVIV